MSVRTVTRGGSPKSQYAAGGRRAVPEMKAKGGTVSLCCTWGPDHSVNNDNCWSSWQWKNYILNGQHYCSDFKEVYTSDIVNQDTDRLTVRSKGYGRFVKRRLWHKTLTDGHSIYCTAHTVLRQTSASQLHFYKRDITMKVLNWNPYFSYS
jgi:hypothetical protein